MALMWIDQHLDVKSDDPDIRRKGRLLNTLLLGLLILSGIPLIIEVALYLLGQPLIFGPGVYIFWGPIFILGILIIWFINSMWSTMAANVLFLVFLTSVILVTDLPIESIWQDPLSLLVLPIIISSMILWPSASFITATIAAVIIFVGARFLQISTNQATWLSHYAVAFISWLTARSLENALDELRVLNAELDARVARRTKQLELSNEQLTVARDKALEASRFKTELTARVSHELRTPLGSILGYSEMLRSGYYGPVTEVQKEPINKIIDTNRELSQLINDLIDQARLESGNLQLDYVIVQTSSLLRYVSDLMQVLAHDKGLRILSSVADDAPKEIYTDELRLQQILINLIGNAIKFTDHGRVAVTFFRKDAEHWGIKVSDTGQGIPEEALPFIFDAFQQVDGTASRQFSGSGLGLSIVEQLVQIMNGDILVESKVGEGTIFTVVLPIDPQNNGVENG